MRESALYELDYAFQSETFRDGHKQVDMIRHDNEGVQQELAFATIPKHRLAEQFSHTF